MGSVVRHFTFYLACFYGSFCTDVLIESWTPVAHRTRFPAKQVGHEEVQNRMFIDVVPIFVSFAGSVA